MEAIIKEQKRTIKQFEILNIITRNYLSLQVIIMIGVIIQLFMQTDLPVIRFVVLFCCVLCVLILIPQMVLQVKLFPGSWKDYIVSGVMIQALCVFQFMLNY